MAQTGQRMPPIPRGAWRFFWPQTGIEADWHLGMKRDMPRTAIPPGAVYDAADYMLEKPGVAYKRGGSTAFSSSSTANVGSWLTSVFDDPFSGATERVLAVDSDIDIYKVTASTSTVLGGGSVGPNMLACKPVFVGNLLVWGDAAGTGTSGLNTWDGTTLAFPTPGGTGPTSVVFLASYGSRLVTCDPSINKRRIWFSDIPSITSNWSDASYIDMDHPVTGMATLPGALLVFSVDYTERIIGTTPPPGSDMIHTTIHAKGCSDARSIAPWNGTIIFASPDGVQLTNGAQVASLTEEGGIATYWQSLFSGYISPVEAFADHHGLSSTYAWTLAGGVYRDFYVVSLSGLGGFGAPPNIATLVCHIPTRSWWRVTNHPILFFAERTRMGQELFAVTATSRKVLKLSSWFNPTASNKNDLNGVAVTPFLETRLIGAGANLKHFDRARLSYDMRDAATDNPTLAVSVAPGIEATTYTAASESPLAETTDETRGRFTIGKRSQGVSVRLQQTGPSSKTEIYGLEVDLRNLEGQQLGQ